MSAELVADLDNDDFTEREKATTELAKRGRKVEAELQQGLREPAVAGDAFPPGKPAGPAQGRP